MLDCLLLVEERTLERRADRVSVVSHVEARLNVAINSSRDVALASLWRQHAVLQVLVKVLIWAEEGARWLR